MPVRIYDIAKKYGLENKEILTKAKSLGIAAAKVPSSSLDKISAEWLEGELLKDHPDIAAKLAAPKVVEAPKPPPVEEKIQIISAPPPPEPKPEPVKVEAKVAAPPVVEKPSRLHHHRRQRHVLANSLDEFNCRRVRNRHAWAKKLAQLNCRRRVLVRRNATSAEIRVSNFSVAVMDVRPRASPQNLPLRLNQSLSRRKPAK